MSDITAAPDTLSLPDELTIGALAAMKERVDEHLATHTTLVLDGQPVETIDGAGVQFLIACLSHTPDTLDKPIALHSNRVIDDAFGSIGAGDILSACRLEDR